MRKPILVSLGFATLGIIFALSLGSAAFAQGTVTPIPLFSPSTPTCSRTITNFAALLERDFKFKPQAQPDKPGYCEALETELNVFAEALLKPPTIEGIAGESKDSYAFIDFGARQFVGTMPRGTKFTAVARNSLPGSQMAFVAGEGFAVFVDFAYTTLTQTDFDSLPDYRDYQGNIQAFCSALWCKAPGVKPTQSN